MDDLRLSQLMQRIDKLERGNRRLRLAGLLVLVMSSALGMMAQTAIRSTPKVVEAERFVVRDTNGAPRGVWDSSAGGVGLYDDGGKPRAMLVLGPDGTPRVTLADQSGKPRVSLGVAADGTPRLVLTDRGLKPRVTLGVESNGSGLALLDEAGRLRGSVTVAVDGSPSLEVHDETGKVFWKVP
jgi:hypothetical protein